MDINLRCLVNTLTNQLNSELERYSNRIRTLDSARKEIQNEMQAVQHARLLARGLRVGVSTPVFMSVQEKEHWLFVKKLELESAENELQITELTCLVIPEMLRSQTRYELPPGECLRCEDVIHTPDMLADEITSQLSDVELGNWKDALVVPCDKCGIDAPLICRRFFDYERKEARVSVGVLCLNCPQYFESAHFSGPPQTIPFLRR